MVFSLKFSSFPRPCLLFFLPSWILATQFPESLSGKDSSGSKPANLSLDVWLRFVHCQMGKKQLTLKVVFGVSDMQKLLPNPQCIHVALRCSECKSCRNKISNQFILNSTCKGSLVKFSPPKHPMAPVETSATSPSDFRRLKAFVFWPQT